MNNCWSELAVRRLGGCVWLALKQVNAIDDDEVDQDEAAAEAEPAPDGNGNVMRPLPRHVRGVQCLTQCSSSGQDKWASCGSDNGDEAEEESLSIAAWESHCVVSSQLSMAAPKSFWCWATIAECFACLLLAHVELSQWLSRRRRRRCRLPRICITLSVHSSSPTPLPSVYLPLYLPLSVRFPFLVSVCSTLPYANVVCMCVVVVVFLNQKLNNFCWFYLEFEIATTTTQTTVYKAHLELVPEKKSS